MARRASAAREAEVAQRVLRHWHEAVPGDRMAHLVKDAMRALQRSLQARLAQHEVQPGHWVFLRVLWQRDGITKRELSIEAGMMEPTTPALHWAMTSLGVLTMNMGEAMTGKRTFCNTGGNMDFNLLVKK